MFKWVFIFIFISIFRFFEPRVGFWWKESEKFVTMAIWGNASSIDGYEMNEEYSLSFLLISSPLRNYIFFYFLLLFIFLQHVFSLKISIITL